MIDPDFWRGKRVFLTGHTGFKGTYASLMLARLGARVIGYSLEPATKPNLFSLIGASSRLEQHIISDIRDADAVVAAMRSTQPDVVLHMAAQSLVRRSYREPSETFAVNVMGTAHVLDAVRATPSVKAAIIVTTDKVYDLSLDESPRRESDPLGGHDPYSSSKAAAEIVTSAWTESFFSAARKGHTAHIATVRSGNVIGGGDWSEDRIVTDIVGAFAAGHKVPLRYPNGVRPWLFVLDTLTGYLVLAERLVREGNMYAGAWNFGPLLGEELNVRDLVEIFAQEWGVSDGWEHAAGNHPPESLRLRLDPSKAILRLGWRPTLDQSKAIHETAAWYHYQLVNTNDAAGLCEDAITRHFARIWKN
jgi:CDP-glucose 4,6-dehydratase